MGKTVSEGVSRRYSGAAQGFHWLTALLVAILVPTGIVMADRGARNVWDALTNNLYSTHKLIGFALLWIVVLRLVHRLISGAPQAEVGLATWQVVISHANHWALYALLLIMPVLGWLGVSMFPALDIFGLFSLPGIANKSDLANQVLAIHKGVAWALIGLVALHVSAALFHFFFRKDSVLQRMLPRSWGDRFHT
jgi:cytochrome b561